MLRAGLWCNPQVVSPFSAFSVMPHCFLTALSSVTVQQPSLETLSFIVTRIKAAQWFGSQSTAQGTLEWHPWDPGGEFTKSRLFHENVNTQFISRHVDISTVVKTGVEKALMRDPCTRPRVAASMGWQCQMLAGDGVTGVLVFWRCEWKHYSCSRKPSGSFLYI